MKLSFSPPKERKERRSGFFERLKICPKPPEPPPRPPNRLEVVLRRVHKEGVMATREIISASVASLVSVAATQPFDELKYKYLTKSMFRNSVPWFNMYNSRFMYEIKSILATKGFGRFYRGHFEAQRESLFQTISMFYTYQRVYQELENFELIFKNYPNLCIFFSGFVSASISVLLLRPYATFQDRLANKRKLLRKFGPTCSAFTLKQKIKWYSAFKGCFADFLYTGTQFGLRFLTYSKISEEMLARKPENIQAIDDYFRSDESTYSELGPPKVIKSLTSWEALLAGGLSGLISDLATHPMDVINNRLKMHSLVRQLYRYDETCRRYGQCMRVIWKKNKIRGFYPGFLPLLLKSSISTAVTFAVYDAFHEWLQLYLLAG